MRVALLLLLATAASAQAPDSVATRRARPDLMLAGAGAGVVVARLGSRVVRSVGAADDGVALLLYPVGVAAGVYGLARLKSLDGTLGQTVRETLRGTLIGYVGGGILAGAGFALDPRLFARDRNGAADALILGGAALVLLAPPFAASRAFRDAEPTVLVGPDGERAAGLRLRVGL